MATPNQSAVANALADLHFEFATEHPNAPTTMLPTEQTLELIQSMIGEGKAVMVNSNGEVDLIPSPIGVENGPRHQLLWK
jgi:hypothetical protein